MKSLPFGVVELMETSPPALGCEESSTLVATLRGSGINGN